MSKDTIKVNMNVYDIPIVVEQLKKLEQENKQLKEELETLKDGFDFNLGAIENIRKGKNELEEKIDKAIEYIKEMPDEEEYNGLLYDNEEKRDLLKILGDKENE